MKTKKIKLRTWQKIKPDFPCVFVTRYILWNEWEYGLYILKKTDGENEKGESGWYLGIFSGDGSEWGDLSDFRSQEYFIIEKTENK